MAFPARRCAIAMRTGVAAAAAIVTVVAVAGCAGDPAQPPEEAPPADVAGATPADGTDAAATGTPADASEDGPVATVTIGPGGTRISDAETAPELRAAPAAGEADFSRTLFAADRRADEYVALDPESRGAARRRDLLDSALQAFAAEHLERLLACAADAKDPDRRYRSVKVLAFANDRRATAAAVEALRVSSDPALQTAAAFALSRLADPDTPDDVLLETARSPDVDVRSNSLLALSRVLAARGTFSNFIDENGRERVLELLGSALFDPEDAMARGNAAAVAGALGDPRATDSLLNLLRDEDPFVRAQTARALGRVGGRRSIEPLLAVIDESARGAPRTAVLAALTQLLSRERVRVPDDLQDDERTWTEFVHKAWADQARRPLR